MTPTNADLHQFLTHRYNLEGLKTLCLYLDLDPDNLDGRTKDTLARELILLMGRLGRVAELVALQAQAESAFARRSQSNSQKPLAHDPRRVFISHAHQDTTLAHRLAADLEKAGWPVWIAPESIRPGEQWLPAIARGLQECGVCAVILTPDGVASSWVEYETNLAISRERRGQMRLLLLDVAPCEVPFGWTGYQYVPFRRSYEAGLGELLGWLDGEDPRPTLPPQTERTTTPAPPPPRSSARFPGYRVLSPDRIVHEKTEIEFVRVPAGPFLYGEGADQKKLELPEYWIGRYPVTNAQYKRFLDANPTHPVPFRDGDWAKPYNWDKQTRTFPADRADHPAVLVNWNDARAFCDWAGLRLLAEQEWEKAARGDKDGRIYPWGVDWVDGRCNTSEAGVGGTTGVGQYSPQGDGPYGCADMAGNVWEWTASWYDKSQIRRVLRGGSWNVNQRSARVSFRGNGTPVVAGIKRGFRVVAPVDSGS